MCPSCGEPMAALELDGIEVDHCLACHGTWLDRGEFEAIGGRAGIDRESLAGFEEAVAQGPTAGRRRCPRCRRRLRVASHPQAREVEIDSCPRGHGAWFDQGEILKLVSAHSQGRAGPVAAFFADLLRSELETSLKGG